MAGMLLAASPLWAMLQEETPDTTGLPPLICFSENSDPEASDLTVERLLQDHDLFTAEPLPDLKTVRKAMKTTGGDSATGVEATSMLGATTVEYRTGVGLGLGVSSDTAWALSERVRLAPHLDVGVYLLQGLDPAASAAVRNVTTPAPKQPSEEPTHQVQLRLSWQF